MPTIIGLEGKGEAVAMAAASALALGAVALGAVGNEGAPVPIDHQEDAVVKVAKDGAIPEGFAVKTVYNGETPESIAEKLTDNDQDRAEVESVVKDQLGSPSAGDKLLLEVSDTTQTPVVAEQPVAYYVPQEAGAAPMSGVMEVPIIDSSLNLPK